MQRHKSRIAKKVNRVMAYIYVPLLFSFLAYGVTFLLTSDLIKMTISAVELISSDAAPDFNNSYNSIFKKDSVDVSDNNGVQTVKRADVPMAEFGDLYAQLSCDRIGMTDIPIYMGDTDEILKKGIGQNFASNQPGFGSLILLAGHNNMYFSALANVQIGDEFRIDTSYGTYTYRVRETKILDENDKTAYNFMMDHEELVLYTCYPFNTLSRTTKRFFTYCDLVSGPVFVD